MVIQHNISAFNTNRQLGIISGQLGSSTEKLSSGYKINRSADDAAGLAISEKMRKQIRGLDRGALNVEDGISYAQVADGALNEVHDMLQRINELAVQSANGTNSATDRRYINDEVQMLKAEMERIFTTTSFNEKKIWEENITVDKNVIGQVEVQAVTFSTPGSQKLEIDNETFGLLPASTPYIPPSSPSLYHYDRNMSSNYTIHADADGVNLSWSAFNGTHYKTKTITWDELRENDFQFNIGDLFENKDSDGNEITDPAKQLLDAAGDPKFDFSIALNVTAGATNEEIAKGIDKRTMTQYLSSSTTFEDKGSTLSSAGFRIIDTSFVYAAAYADAVLAKEKGTTGYDFENPSDDFIWPKLNASGGNIDTSKSAINVTDLATARASDKGWVFDLKAAGLGEMTAVLSRCSYYANDTVATPSPAVTTVNDSSLVTWSGRDADDMYDFVSNPNGLWVPYGEPHEIAPGKYEYHWKVQRKVFTTQTPQPVTLGTVMSTLTGEKGLLSKKINDGPTGKKGATDAGGRVYLTFDITTPDDKPYTYGKDTSGKDLTSTMVGTFALYFDVTPSDTERSILDKINKAFNSNTLFDLNFTNNNQVSGSVSKSGFHTSTMLKNDYLPTDNYNDINLNIHSGSETTDKIFLGYECLRLKTIGLADTNVLTQNDALAAINEVASALETISAQRSLFGSYQNRMERAYDIDKNSSENAQYAESKIRDTEMAEEMVNYSNLNILGQAGQSMLAQANQKNQGILSLLR